MAASSTHEAAHSSTAAITGPFDLTIKVESHDVSSTHGEMVAVIAALFLTKHNANVTILSDHLNCVRFVGTMRQVAWENLMPIRWESKKPADLHQWLTTEATASHANIKHVKAHTDATDRSQNSTTGQTDWPRQPTVEHIWCSRLSYSVHEELRGIHHGLLSGHQLRRRSHLPILSLLRRHWRQPI